MNQHPDGGPGASRTRADLSYLRAIMDSVAEAIITIDRQGIVWTFNAEAEKIFGYTADEVVGRSVGMLMPSPPREDHDGYLERYRRSGEAHLIGRERELEGLRKDGSTFTMTLRVRELEGVDEGGYIGTVRDVTDRVDAQRQLRMSEQRYRSLVTATAQMVWVTDADGRVVEPIPTWQEYTGQSFAEVAGDGWIEAIHPDDRERTASAWARAVKERSVYTILHRIRRHDGVYREFAVRAAPVLEEDGTIREWVGTSSDITERKAAEDELRSSRERLQAVVDSSRLAIVLSTLEDGRILEVNPAFTRIFGHTAQEARGRTAAELGLWKDEAERRRVLEAARLWSDGAPNRVKLRAASGEERVVYSSWRQIEVEGKRCILSVLQDATELEDTQRALLTQTDYLRLLQDVTSTVAESADFEAALSLALRETCRRTGWDVGHIYRPRPGSEVWEPSGLWYPDPPDGFAELRRATERKTFRPGEGIIGKVAATAAPIWVTDVSTAPDMLRAREASSDLGVGALAATPVVDHGEVVAILEFFRRTPDEADATLQDILLQIGTQLGRVAERIRVRGEKERIENMARQAQKMEAVGRLAGGVAHDFNNMLTVIFSEVDLLRLMPTVQGDETLRTAISEIGAAAERAAELTRQLLTFSRQDVRQSESVDVAEALEGLRGMLRRLIGEHVRLHVRTPERKEFVRADRGQLEQVIVNLVVNARDAMPDGGDVTIDVEIVELRGERLDAFEGLAAGDYVCISFTDTGCGMPEHVRERVFEPFFTTKDVGQGTGLGLSTSYGIVERSGGRIHVYSEEGVGTTFRIYLPRVEAPDSPRSASGTEHPDVEGGSETVLFVEDDPALRRIGRRTLKSLGYTVIEAEDGATALAELARHGRGIDLLFTDVVLPGMSGREVVERAREQEPGLKVLYTTGYTKDVALRFELDSGEELVLTKPYTTAQLAAKVRLALGSDPS